MVAPTYADGQLGPAKVVADFNRFYSAEQMLLNEGAAPARLMQGISIITSFSGVIYAKVLIIPAVELFSYTNYPTPPFPQSQSAFALPDAALHPTHAVAYSTPQISGPWPTGALLWPHDGPVMEPHQSPSTAGLGIVGLWPTASSCPCVGLSTGHICAHQLFSSVAWVSSPRTSLLASWLMFCTW